LPGPVSDATEGATKGFLNWTKEQVLELARKLTDKEVAFVEDKPTAETIKKQKDTSDYGIIVRFLPRGHLRVLVSLGLALRQMEHNPEAVAKLKNNIHDQFGSQGLRAAELVQIGIVSQLLTRLTRIYSNPKDVERRLVAFLEHVEQLAIWVAKEDMKNYKRISDLVKVRVDTNASQMVILLGRAEKATAAVLKILHVLKQDPRDYFVEVDQSGYQLTAYVFPPEVRGRLADRWDSVAIG
jgi:hypothetical protein